MPLPPGDVTQALHDARSGDSAALDRLIPLVYDELKALAHHKLSFEPNDLTLMTGDLVHEAYVRLTQQHTTDWRNRAHFFALAAQTMRRILISHARKRTAVKRGGALPNLSLGDVPESELPMMSQGQADHLLALDEALHRLQAFNPRGGAIVEYRYFGGLTNEEIAHVMDLSPATIQRSWVAARAWLAGEITLA